MTAAFVPVTETLSPWTPGLFCLLVFGVLVVLMMAVVLILTGWIGERRDSIEKQRPYESGVIPTGSARFSYPVPFYLVATFFLLFDVEAAFIFSWAIAFEPLGWKGFVQMAVFIGILLASLVYLWKKGGLEWGPPVRKR